MYLKNKWAVTATHKQMQADPTVREIAQELGIRLPTAQLIFNRGCTTPKMAVIFLSKKLIPKLPLPLQKQRFLTVARWILYRFCAQDLEWLTVF